MQIENWSSILDTYLHESRHLKFKWGETDCALWCGKYVKQIGVSNLIETFQGKYDSEFGATKILLQNGYHSLEEMMDKNFEKIEIAYSKRGDIVMWQNALGICAGINSFFLTQENGLTIVKTKLISNAWSTN